MKKMYNEPQTEILEVEAKASILSGSDGLIIPGEFPNPAPARTPALPKDTMQVF